MTTETHYGVRYTAECDQKWHITDYETDEAVARRECANVQAGWPYTTELMTRTVKISACRVVTS